MSEPLTTKLEALADHWDTPEGAEMAADYVGKDRADLAMGHLSDMALANGVFLASRHDLDLIAYQTAAKERIRWLSAQLAAALRLAGEGWQDISTAPKGVTLIGLRDPSATGRQPAFIGEVYGMRKNALIDCWSGRWAVCTHWRPLPEAPAKETE